MVRTRLSPLFVCAVLTACGGAVEPASSSPDAAASPSSPPDAGAKPDASVCAYPCPLNVPLQGAPCDVGMQCEYGGAPTTLKANVTAFCTCFGGGWSVSGPPIPANCAGFGSGSPCSAVGASCEYPQGACACAAHDGGSTWTCEGQTSPTCPWPRPLLGSSCDPDAGVSCSGSFSGGASFYRCVPIKGCGGGHWVLQVYSTLPSPC